jgi:hypothetical protein
MAAAILKEKEMSELVPSDESGLLPKIPPLSKPVLVAAVAAKILLHLPGLFRYGYFRDELYFLDCARHLDWGYVDCAPLVAVYAKIALLFGGSLPALRVLAILAGAGTVALTVLLARQLGGGSYAQALAAIAIIFASVHLMVANILSMNVFEPLFWMGCAFALIRIIRGADPRLWLVFGVLAGLGLQNKHSTVFFGAALAVRRPCGCDPRDTVAQRAAAPMDLGRRGGRVVDFHAQHHLAVAARFPNSRRFAECARDRQEHRARTGRLPG